MINYGSIDEVLKIGKKILGSKTDPVNEILSNDIRSKWEEISSNIEIAPEGEIDNWSNRLDRENRKVSLDYYKGHESNVIVYGKYKIEGEIYDTKIKSNFNDSSYMFKYSGATPNVKDIKTITFNKGIDTSMCTNFFMMFSNCTSLTEINGLEYFDTSNVTNMNSMFEECTSLVSLNLTSFDTSKATNMKNMFKNCTNLEEILVSRDKWVIPNKCNIDYMFSGCGTNHVTYVD